MEFRTVCIPEKSSDLLSHQQAVMLLGSCFSEHIGTKLRKHKFTVCSNPFGTLYNPISIAQSLSLLTGNQELSDADFLYTQEQYVSIYHNTTFAAPSKASLIKLLQANLEKSRQFLAHTDFVLLTLGTAFVYKHIELDKIVSNCHKIPSSTFERFCLSAQEVEIALREAVNQLRELNPAMRIVFTVSPVRHLKDGFAGNSLSKATLRLGIEALAEEGMASYFPSYELVLDDLRDYRFYEPDMLHMNAVGIDYIWEKFSQSYFSEATHQINKRIANIQKALEHKFVNPDSAESMAFKSNLISKIKEISKEFQLDYSDALARLESQG